MKTIFCCLANSKKYGERCIAGIEIKKTKSGYEFIEKDGKPKWIRPVSEFKHGAVSSELVGTINLLDVVEIEVEEFCPSGYQCENALFEQSSLKKVTQIRPLSDNLDMIVDMTQTNLFGNRGKAVSAEVIDMVGHSLTFIKVTYFEIFRRESDGQLRMKFEFNHNTYDLPITDMDFINKFNGKYAIRELHSTLI